VRRQRQDFHQKVALQLVRTNDTISHEDLQTAHMLKNQHLAKSVSDAGWSQFWRILAASAANAGRRVVAVPPAYTSQRCSGALLWPALRHHGLEGLLRALARLPSVRNEPAAGPQRRQD
jgi:IS605 OrfB family transposase